MKAARLVAILLSSLVLLAAGCSVAQRVSMAGFERPTFTFESWAIEGIDFEGVSLSLRYRVDNPNARDLDLVRLSYLLEVEGRPIATGELPSGARIVARSATPLTFPVRLLWRDVPALMERLGAGRALAYRVTGKAGIGTAFGVLELPYAHQGHVTPP